jgi:hypothetical protein
MAVMTMKKLPSKTFILALTLATSCFLANPHQGLTQQVAGNTDAAQLAANIANTSRDWLNGRLSTPGTSGELHEAARSNQSGQLVVRYNIVVKGAPKDQIYTLLSWPINAPKPLEQMKGVSIGADGLVICAGKTAEQCVGEKENDLVDFVLSPAQGEVFRMALVSADGKTKIFFATVPDPIIKKSKTCSLEVIRLLPRFELVLIRAKGYVPNEDLLFASKSYDESQDRRVKADGDGGYFSALMPFVRDKQNGKTSLSLMGGGCSLELSFEWGK